MTSLTAEGITVMMGIKERRFGYEHPIHEHLISMRASIRLGLQCDVRLA
jgi:hypothetical protein